VVCGVGGKAPALLLWSLDAEAIASQVPLPCTPQVLEVLPGEVLVAGVAPSLLRCVRGLGRCVHGARGVRLEGCDKQHGHALICCRGCWIQCSKLSSHDAARGLCRGLVHIECGTGLLLTDG